MEQRGERTSAEEGREIQTSEPQSHVERLSDAFRDAWADERHEGDPEVEFAFRFTSHERPVDARHLKEDIAQADVFIPELAGWSKEDLVYEQAIANGEEEPPPLHELKDREELEYLNYGRARFQALHKSGVFVRHIDVPEGHPILEQMHVLNQQFQDHREGNLEEEVAFQKQWLREGARVDQDREHYMMRHLPGALREAIDTASALKGRDHLRVLISLGSSHTPLSHGIVRAGGRVTRHFPEKPYHYWGIEGAARQYLFQKSEPSDELIARAIFGYYLSNLYIKKLYAVCETSEQRDDFINEITERFSYEEIREVWDSRVREAQLMAKLAQKGLKIPDSKEELEAFMTRSSVART